MELPPLLRPGDLAPLLGLTAHGVRAMLRRGELPGSKLGRQWVVRRAALEGHLRREERRNRPAKADVARLLQRLPTLRRRRR